VLNDIRDIWNDGGWVTRLMLVIWCASAIGWTIVGILFVRLVVSWFA